VIVDVSGWGHLRLTGADHVRFLQSTCTANVAALAPGAHAWGAILSPKGRVLTVLQAVRGADHVTVHVEPGLLDKTAALLDRYAVMDEVEFTRVDGPAYMTWPAPDAPSAAAAWDAPVVMAALPGPAAAADDVEIVRVAAGLVRYGVDVDEDHFPFETPLARWLDYGKGCYIGQEPVFRVHSRGEAARTLRALLVEGAAPVAAGASVSHPDRPAAGTVTSSVVSPRHGVIALAYVHRTVWAPGGEVTVDGRPAKIHELPL
jgi:folate-binding protein YgfZ